MRSKIALLTGVCLLVVVPACNWLTPLVFVGEHKKQVLAEFDKLPGHRTAVLVWTPPETLFDYPFARLELATYVADKLVSEMAANKTEIDMVDPLDVEDFLGKTPNADVDPRLVGKHFKVDYVINIEVVEFQIRDPDRPQFLRGRIQASVAVHDIGADPDLPQSYELTPVQTTYPDTAPVLMSPTNSLLIREQTYRKFGEEIARKFYEYAIDL